MSTAAVDIDAEGPWVPEDRFGHRLYRLRKEMGWTQAEAAAACGLDDGSWSNWENGTRPRDKVEIVEAIAAATKVDREWLLFGGPIIRWKGDPTHLTSLDMPSGQMHLPLDAEPELELVGPPS